MRRCMHCGQVIVWREMFAPGPTNMNGATEPAHSVGHFWLGANIGGDSTVCDVRARVTAFTEHPGDRHEPIPLVPDLTDATAVADWLEQ